MSPPRRVRTQDDLRQAEKQLREQGFSDGWAGREARYSHVTYQRAWKLGMKAGRKDREQMTDGAA